MVNLIKRYISGDILYNFDKELNQLQGLLFDASNKYPKENNFQARVSNIINLISQIKKAFGILSYELKQLHNELLYLETHRSDRRR